MNYLKKKLKLLNIKLQQQKYYNKFSYLTYKLKLNQINLNLLNLNNLITTYKIIYNINLQKNIKFILTLI